MGDFANVLLIRCRDGWTFRENADSIAEWGRVEAFWSTNLPLESAHRVADVRLLISGRPQVQKSAVVLPETEADLPLVSYGIGDPKVIPDENGDPELEYVFAISLTEQSRMRTTSIVLDFADPVLQPGEKAARIQETKSPGTLGGSWIAQLLERPS